MAPLGPGDPTALGRFRLLGHLGSGGMGRVYLGIDAEGRQAAVKVVHAELAAEPAFRERFRREIAMAGRVPAWFTAPVVDAAPDADPPWLATAYVEGPSLQDRAPTGDREVTDLAVRLAAGLATVHAAGLVHRDLKPSNIMLAVDGPRVIDFGIARAADTSALTQTGHVLGTPEFMSPEQASGARDVGPPSDVFALGSVLAFAVTGRSPFAAENPAGALYNVVYAEPDLTALPGRLRGIVAGCLAKDPAARPTAAQLAAVLQERPAAEPTLAPRPRRWGLWAAVIGSAVAASLVTLAVMLFLGRGAPAPTTPVADAPTSTPVPTAAPTTTATTPALPPPTVVRDVGAFDFFTPSGNIACSGGPTGEIRCDVAENDWVLPPAPPGCTGAWGVGAVLGVDGPGELLCASDTVANQGLPVVPYGEGVRFGPTVCVVRETGVRCDNASTGHGFAVARAAFELF